MIESDEVSRRKQLYDKFPFLVKFDMAVPSVTVRGVLSFGNIESIEK